MNGALVACILVAVRHQKTRMRKLRRDRDLTLEFVSRKTGVPVSTVSRIERLRMKPSERVQKRLEKFFNLPVDQLLEPVESAA